MKFLIVGSGGREHAIGYKLHQSPMVDKIYFAPGNGGTSLIGENIVVNNLDELVSFVKNNSIDITFVGPEVPLSEGIVDLFKLHGLAIFGPDKSASRLESSKSFAKIFMDKYNIPTARYEVYDNLKDALNSIESWSLPLVIKADGLAAGKGVVICKTAEEVKNTLINFMDKSTLGTSGNKVVIEKFLEGDEVSLLCLTDGKTILPLRSASDYKKAYDGNTGPNTGGMGSVSPAFSFKNNEASDIIQKTLYGIQCENFNYHGVIYIGLILTKSGAKVLEYNVRFGDPETQAIMPRLQTDMAKIIKATIDEKLSEITLDFSDCYSVCVILASDGYPGKYLSNKIITNLPENEENLMVFHAGTTTKCSKLKTSGGRILAVCALSPTLEGSRKIAYENINKINCSGSFFRTDIGLVNFNKK